MSTFRTGAPARPAFRILVATIAAIASAVLFLPAASAGTAPRSPGNLEILQGSGGLPDLDARTGVIAPNAAQLATVQRLGAHASWNQFGTPQSLIHYGGYLATGLGADAVSAARSFLSSNAPLFRLSATGLSNLELLNDSKLTGTSRNAHAVLFRQTFGGIPAANDGLIDVGVVDGNVAYASSTSAGDGNTPAAAVLTPTQAWLKAAGSVERLSATPVISQVHTIQGWTVFAASGFAQAGRSRLRALPTTQDGVRPAYETIVEDVQGGNAVAYTVFVDAVTGKIWLRHNDVDQNQQAEQFQGAFTPVACGPEHKFTVDASTKSIDVVAGAEQSENDILLSLQHPMGVEVANSDEATSPEAIHYAPAIFAPGDYFVQVCPSPAPAGPFVAPFDYVGTFTSNDTATPQPPFPPRWKFFTNAPPLDYSNTDTRTNACWTNHDGSGAPIAGCDLVLSPAGQPDLASRTPWDYSPNTNTPTYTSSGNNAQTAEAWISPLTPGGTEQKPVDPDRTYGYADNPNPQPDETFTNAWHNSKCDPTTLVPGGNDILASVTNLFSGHNRFHDFSYNLGFNEQNYNMQQDNFGNTPPGPYPGGREDDPEVGNVQAGAISGGAPSYLGRDNANQITLNDGIPGVTNQYLFQPIAGAFYAPCTDGSFDTTVFGHEYTHAISNRMVAGPDTGLSGGQSGAMGESWSDLDALEYLHEYGYIPIGGESPWAEGPYVTGNKQVGIRDYALNANPLNYSDVGFDTPGFEVHADGEIWNGTNYTIRDLLVRKYNHTYPESDKALQTRCAGGILPADKCPGNRRWIQLVYDGWLLDASGNITMLDARDSYLAADMMRFGGANQTQLWHAFAQRGMGTGASSTSNNDADPTPSFQSPAESNATVTISDIVQDANGHPSVPMKLFVGDYQAGVVPIADTDPNTATLATFKIVPGTYDFRVQSDGYGIHGFSHTFTAGQTTTLRVNLFTNWASTSQGATATGDGTDLTKLIDDNEGTDWTATDSSSAKAIIGKEVFVHLGGTGAHSLNHLHVSAMLSAPAVPGGTTQSRFTALRQFAIYTCDSTQGSDCSKLASYTLAFVSAANAFPGELPRPLAPELIIRHWKVQARATDIMLKVLNNQCTGGPQYQGDQDNDPSNNTDCTSGSANGQTVHAAELQIFKAAAFVTVLSNRTA